MVAVTGAPGNDTVIRRAARIAARSKSELLALHVLSAEREARPSIAALRELVVAVGGSWQTAEGDDVAATIMRVAMEQQITQIVLGTSKISRWQSVTRGGSVLQQILRLAATDGIDVHVIARQVLSRSRPRYGINSGPGRRRPRRPPPGLPPACSG